MHIALSPDDRFPHFFRLTLSHFTMASSFRSLFNLSDCLISPEGVWDWNNPVPDNGGYDWSNPVPGDGGSYQIGLTKKGEVYMTRVMQGVMTWSGWDNNEPTEIRLSQQQATAAGEWIRQTLRANPSTPAHLQL